MSAQVTALLQNPHLKTGLVVIGAVVVLSYVLTFLKGIYARILRPGKNLKLNYGVWGEFCHKKCSVASFHLTKDLDFVSNSCGYWRH
jgi:hypothetical protein